MEGNKQDPLFVFLLFSFWPRGDVSTETSFGQPLPEKSIHMKQNVVTDLGMSVISSVSPPGISMKFVSFFFFFFAKRADVS